LKKIVQFLTAPALASLRATIAAAAPLVLDEAVRIQQIPAPTFHEDERAAYLVQRFRQLGLAQVEVDSLHTVYGCLPGANPAVPALLVSAHTDTVFDAHTSLAVRRTDDRIYGPGIGDNSLGVAALLAVAGALHDHPLRPFPAEVWFVANSREEGLGNLDGIREAYQRLQPRLGAAIVIEGMAFGRIYHAGIAVRRLKIACHGQGGHSWLHFGRASAIHGLMQLGTAITQLRPPDVPRTTFNIGVIEGGTTVNSIATDASMLVDLRSESRDALAALEHSVLALVQAHKHLELEFVIHLVGDRPAGSIPRGHGLVQLARHTLEVAQVTPIYETGSTDANVFLAAGLPAITVGVTHGGNAHRLDEFIETGPLASGLAHLAALVAGAASGLVG
jgi:acetylornithine deacetylase/succinyl-diaminopimelate desuccinylase-like protein